MSWWVQALLWFLWGGACFAAGTWWATRPQDTRWKDITRD